MKFLTKDTLKKNNIYYTDNLFEFISNHPITYHNLIKLGYLKKNVKNRKVLLNIKKGLTKTEKKNSLKRDKNNTLLQQYLNIMLKNGDKGTLFKNVNKSVENFFLIFNNENEEFYNYKNYLILNYLINNFMEYNDFNYLLEIFLPQYCSIFDIKTVKNKKKSKSLKKYKHEILYIPESKRLKNLLKIINIYSNNFKNYFFWERLLWLFINLITDKNKTNLLKRRSFIYKKSIKFFKNTKNK